MLSQKTEAVTARKSYIVCEDEDRFKIGQIMLLKTAMQLLFENLKQQFPELKDSNVQTFNQKVKKELNLADKGKQKVKKLIPKYSIPTVGPLMLGQLDKIEQVYLKAINYCGTEINTNIANAIAKALVHIVGIIDID